MSDKVYTITELSTALNPIFEEFHIKKAILFGSYGKLLATEKSDVDLLVDSGLKGLKFVGLIESIREVLDKEVDVFDVQHINPGSPIDEEIKSTGVLIYGK